MQFIEEKIDVIIKKLEEFLTKNIKAVSFEYANAPEYKKSNTPLQDAEWKRYESGTMLCGVDTHYWFRFQIDAIAPKQNKELRLCIKTGREGQWDATNPQGIIYLNGVTTQGLDANHCTVSLEYGKSYDVLIYYYTGMIKDNACAVSITLEECDIEVEKLYYDLSVPYKVMKALSPNDSNHTVIKNAINHAVMMLDLRKPYSDEYYESVKNTLDFMDKEFYQKECGKNPISMSCIGQTHIDIAWFWTVMQTREKAQRSFATAINLMNKYDEYKFMSSQPLLYQFVKENDPLLYEKIKERIKEGRWEVEGGMWIEPDVNLSSGESLIRQIYHGKKFMRDEFGVESHILWLPDCFGFTAALPQILIKSGIDRFFTTKMVWNETNKMPHSLFMWRGIDGSEIFTSIDFNNDYKIDPQNVLNACENFKDKELTNNRFLIFGWGDGGGGPSRQQLEYQRRLEKGIPGMPKLVIESANNYFDKVEADFAKNTKELCDLPKWSGELYLELHRGTYTFMSESKRFNRKCEIELMETEGLSVWNMIINNNPYPQTELKKALLVIMLNQFHDILPGSAVKEVYDISYAEYTETLNKLETIKENTLCQLAHNIKTDGGVLVYNPTSFVQSGTVHLGENTYFADNIPAFGWKVIGKNEDLGITVLENIIENDVVRVVFDDKYEIASLYDKELGREIVDCGKTINRLCVYEDYPKNWDAWDISTYYKQKMWKVDDVQSVEQTADGLEIRRKYGNSDIVQRIKLCRGSKRIDFATTVDWHEDHVLLRAEFPVNINANTARYDIQFGYKEFPTHQNTSWDESRFEVCAHKWVDLSEGNYGVSLMSDCKYGYNAQENILGISLLKAATWPNEDPDTGIHAFTYSLYPHKGDITEGNVYKTAYQLNMPLIAVEIGKNNGTLPECTSMIFSDKQNVIIETIKKAEEGNTIIVRLYEAHNCKENVTITTGFDFKEAYICDLMENCLQKLECNGRNITINIKNFEIVTLKLVK